MSAHRATCHGTFGALEKLDDHFHEVFTPPDDIAPATYSTSGCKTVTRTRPVSRSSMRP